MSAESCVGTLGFFTPDVKALAGLTGKHVKSSAGGSAGDHFVELVGFAGVACPGGVKAGGEGLGSYEGRRTDPSVEDKLGVELGEAEGLEAA